MKSPRKAWLLGTLVLAFLFSGCVDKAALMGDEGKSGAPVAESNADEGGGQGETLAYTLHCSVETLPLSLALAEAFSANSGVKMDVLADGNEQSLESIQKGHIGLLSGDLADAGLKETITQAMIGYRFAGLIANTSSTLEGATAEEVTALFIGDTDTLGEVTPDVVVTDKDQPGRALFETLFETKGKINGRYQSLFPETFFEAPSSEAVVDLVAENTNAIGLASSLSLSPKVKWLAIGGVTPSETTIQDGSYPYEQPVTCLYDVSDEGIMATFIAFIQSPEGKELLSQNDLIITQ